MELYKIIKQWYLARHAVYVCGEIFRELPMTPEDREDLMARLQIVKTNPGMTPKQQKEVQKLEKLVSLYSTNSNSKFAS